MFAQHQMGLQVLVLAVAVMLQPAMLPVVMHWR